MARPDQDVNRVVRTVIEAADPALQPVHKLRRFVVKRIEFVGASPAEKPSRRPGKPSGKRKAAPRPAESSGLRK